MTRIMHNCYCNIQQTVSKRKQKQKTNVRFNVILIVSTCGMYVFNEWRITREILIYLPTLKTSCFDMKTRALVGIATNGLLTI